MTTSVVDCPVKLPVRLNDMGEILDADGRLIIPSVVTSREASGVGRQTQFGLDIVDVLNGIKKPNKTTIPLPVFFTDDLQLVCKKKAVVVVPQFTWQNLDRKHLINQVRLGTYLEFILNIGDLTEHPPTARVGVS